MSLISRPGHLARRFHQISTTLFDAEMRRAKIDLTSVQYAALVAIRDNPCLDQATLASTIVYDRTTIGGVVDRLVDKGFVTRVVSQADRRSRVLTVTDAGADIIERAEPPVIRAQAQLLEHLDQAEAAELLRLLGKVVLALGDVTRPSR
ncbi:MAG: MarR family winged helix-turn-helix transcriptional regulator [Devosia sp.]